MALLRKNVWWRNLLYSPLAFIILIGICAAVAFSVYSRYVIEREVADRRAEKEEELAELEVRKGVLERKVSNLKDEEGVEDEIRRNFDVAIEGEKVVILVDKGEGNASATEPITIPKKRTWLDFWRDLIPW